MCEVYIKYTQAGVQRLCTLKGTYTPFKNDNNKNIKQVMYPYKYNKNTCNNAACLNEPTEEIQH